MGHKKLNLSKYNFRQYTIVDKNGCWIWQRSLRGRGYAQMTDTTTGKQVGGHTLVYRWYKGELPGGLIVLHKCHNPSCVNPKHLVAGTYSDNQRDTWGHPRNAFMHTLIRERISNGALKEAFKRGREIGSPLGLAKMNGGAR